MNSDPAALGPASISSMDEHESACDKGSSADSPVWCSIEGVNGVGKTYLLGLVAEQISAADVAVVAELTDTSDPVPSAVIAAMSTGNSFLRTGFPNTETLALLGLKVREYEQITARPVLPRLVLEDRGVDTVAVYQAVIGAGPHADVGELAVLADRIAATARLWRPPPARVLLLVDDLDACLHRYGNRRGWPVTTEERALVQAAESLYRYRAQQYPSHYRVVDRRGLDDRAVADLLLAQIAELVPGGLR